LLLLQHIGHIDSSKTTGGLLFISCLHHVS